MAVGTEYVTDADGALAAAYEEPMTLAEYVDRAFDQPSIAAHAAKYLLDAIDAAGTRPVIEEGTEKTRYCFFDDPANDGEHAILGNTDVLNGFVDDLRAVAAGRGKTESIVWFSGPTATGKSELKRCLINGLREYSKTTAGRRYTIEWNIETRQDTRGLSYSDAPTADRTDWHESPVQAHPFSVFPPDTRTALRADLETQYDLDIGISVDQRLDPFSREAYNTLEQHYREHGSDDLFSSITAPNHLRVINYVVDVGHGIGVLHAEDDGHPKERLVGSWMPWMLQELDSRGRKNPQAFSYDGVLSQGNGGLTVVEDASQHADLLQKLLNIPEEGTVKLDKGIGLDIDTQLIVISNPDLEAQLNQQADAGPADPLKALKRRLDKRTFEYLTNLNLEVQLIRRELLDEHEVWTIDDDQARSDRIREPATVTVRTETGTTTEREFAPHTIEAAALYDIVTRLDANDLPAGMDLVDKALVFDRGYHQDGNERIETTAFNFAADATDGARGIPVTYTRDVLAGLLREPFDRHHPDLPVEDVIMPRDALDAMVRRLDDAPVFSPDERTDFKKRIEAVRNHVCSQQEHDVTDAMMQDHRVDQATVEEYIEHVYAWAHNEPIENARGEPADPNPLVMKVFETEHLGWFNEDNYNDTDPADTVETFRHEKIITAINRYAWEHRSDAFAAVDVDLTAIPVIDRVLERHDWDDAVRIHADLDPRQWDDPPAGTETERVKQLTIKNLVDRFGYSPAAAELTTREIIGTVSHRWD